MEQTYPFQPQKLPFGVDRLAPLLDRRTILCHYQLHYKKYISQLNSQLKDLPQLHDIPLAKLLSDPSVIPADSREAVIRSAGGVYNHQIYFGCMGRPGDQLPQPKLRLAIGETFGSFEGFKLKFLQACGQMYGSGYVWLASDSGGKLLIAVTKEQESLPQYGLRPVLCCDLWEHAYYLQYLNDRDLYSRNFFRLINWKAAEANYMNA